MTTYYRGRDTGGKSSWRPGNWHLAMTRGGRERITQGWLQDHGFEVYFPMARVMRIVAQRHLSRRQRAAGAVVRKPQLKPLFPGYIFVRFDEADCWHTHFDAAGVYGLVCSGDLPAEVPAKLVDDIQAREQNGAVPGDVLLSELFRIGEQVVISSGPFAQFSAVLEELPPAIAEQVRNGRIEDVDESLRASVAVNILGRLTRIKVPLSNLRRI